MSLQSEFMNCASKDETSGCFVWTRGRHKDGYGHLRVNMRMTLAHRHAWELVNGPVPAGMCVCHKCDNPACVNLEHLFLTDHDGNMLDKRLKDRCASKLSRAEVIGIRRQFSVGATQRSLAKKYGVSFQLIHLIVRNKIWTHV